MKLTDDLRDDDYPSVAVLDNTTAWAVWQSYSGQVDEIRLSKFEGSWRTFTRVPGYERSVTFPGGHQNVFHTRHGIPVVSFFTRTDYDRPRPAGARHETLVEDDTRLLYESLHQTGGISIPHTTGSNMGTDWRDNDPEVEPVVEIFQGDRVSYEHPGGPRAARSAEDRPLGGYQEAGFVWNAYRKGYRIGTIASSDHWSTPLLSKLAIREVGSTS